MDQRSTDQHAPLAAGGSLAALPRSPAGQFRLVIELALLYVGLPIAITYLVRVQHVSVLLLLQPVLLAIVLFLLLDKTFSLKRELGRAPPIKLLLSIAALFVIVGGALTAFVALSQPAQFLGLPRRAPVFWAAIMVFYPLVSAFPQELFYRTLFFHRFGLLFGHRRLLAALANGALFGFAHIMFGNLVSVVLSAAFGFVVAWRYARARTFWAAWIEHAIYGDLVFTIGLGRYFYTGNSFIGH